MKCKLEYINQKLTKIKTKRDSNKISNILTSSINKFDSLFTCIQKYIFDTICNINNIKK